MADQTIAVDSMTDAVRSPEENASLAENTASVSADAEQTTDTKSTNPSEEKSNTVEEVTEESKGSDQSIPYSRFKDVISERNALKEELERVKSKPKVGSQSANRAYNEPESQEAQAKRALQQLGVPDEKTVKSLIDQQIRQERVYRDIDQKVVELQKQWDGKDGKPAFNVEEIVEFGNKTGVFDPESAFKLIHEKELADFYSKQAKTGVKSERQGKPVQNVGKDQDALMKEARKTGDWTKVLQGRL